MQQNTTDILGYDSSEDNDNNIIIAMLVSVFAAFAIVGVLIAYCKSHHQRRNSNRDPSVSFIRNRRELEDLERGDEPLQSEERERLSVQGEDAQQLDSDNEASGPSAHSNTSSHTSSSTSSRSGTASQAGSSVSIEEDGRSGASSEESGSDNSQRSSSPANVPQKPPRTLVQNVEEAGISNSQGSSCYC
ncbi:hypothetical protein [Candidatus Mesenet endosymbiont of Agriotes lineatus]|uniref:hypothetical protein n=1 Tax=Candidatus Mesenet endosymbiont of Agriotes lineatus TaxID=3077948 RepID=UPI0030D28987